MEILAARGLTFRYPGEDAPALDDVTLTVNAGDFAVLCGYSGCGKSTLLRQFKPALAPKGEASGEVRLFGGSASRLSARDAAARIGFLSQSPENMTVTDKVWRELVFGAESLGLPPAEIRRRAAEVSAFFGLDALFYRDTSELSGGQLTLLSLASVMMLRPDAVLLDEPSARLDPVASGNVFAYLAKINRELGTTVLVADHRLEELFPLANRAVVMDGGRVIFDGSPREAAGYLRGARHGMYAALPAAARIASALSGELGEESAAPGSVAVGSPEGKGTAGTPVSDSFAGGMPAATGEIAELPASGAVPGMFTSGGTAAGGAATGGSTDGISAVAQISTALLGEEKAAPGSVAVGSPEGKGTAGTPVSDGFAGGMPAVRISTALLGEEKAAPGSVAVGSPEGKGTAGIPASGGSADGMPAATGEIAELPASGAVPGMFTSGGTAAGDLATDDPATGGTTGGVSAAAFPLSRGETGASTADGFAGGMPAATDPATPPVNVTAGESTPLSVAEGRAFLREFAARHPLCAGDGSAGGSRLPVEGRTPSADGRAPSTEEWTPLVASQPGGEQSPRAAGEQSGEQGPSAGERAPLSMARSSAVRPSSVALQPGGEQTLPAGGQSADRPSFAEEKAFPAAPQPGGDRRSPNGGQSGEQGSSARGRTPSTEEWTPLVASRPGGEQSPRAAGEQSGERSPSAGERTPLAAGERSGERNPSVTGGMLGERNRPAEGQAPPVTGGRSADQSSPAAGRPLGASADRPAGDAILTARGVRFRYGKDLPDVLRGLDFTARRGEICALLGGNGCGKTTALRVFSGALKPYAGKVSSRGKVGFMPQEPETLFTERTLAEELSVCSKGGDAVARVAGVCRLEGLLSRHPYDLSGGEVRRAALAKLLLYEPDILLLDEPTAGMDARFCREFAAILRALCERGAAVVLVSHDTEFCAKYASRCVMLFSGEAVCDEAPREFFAGNRFYTTSAARIAEGIVPGAVTDSDITGAFGVVTPESAEVEPPSPAVSARVPPRRKMPLWRKIGAAVFAAGAFAVMLYASRKGALTGAVGVSGITAKGWRLFGVYGVFFAFLLAAACFLFEKKTPSERGNPPRRPSGKSVAVAALCFAAVPVTLTLGFRFWGRSHYLILSFAVLLECLVPFFALFEGRRPGAGRLAVTATLTALAVGGRAMFFMLPEFKPVLAVTVISGAALGGETGFLVGAVSMLVSNVLFSEGPWTPWQMFAMGLCGLAAGLLFYNANLRRTRAVYAVAGAALALLLYGPVMNLASALMMSGEALTSKLVLTYMLTGFPVDCVHAASSAIFLWFLGEPLTEKLERVRVKYGL